MLKPLITIEDWSGGASLNPSQGKKNGYFLANGADHFSRPGYVAPLPSKQNFLGPSGAGTVNDTLFVAFELREILKTISADHQEKSIAKIALDPLRSIILHLSRITFRIWWSTRIICTLPSSKVSGAAILHQDQTR